MSNSKQELPAMKILVVEDDDTKRERVCELITQTEPAAVIVHARSLRGAEDALETEPFDLVVLDMSMPTFDIGPDESGGVFQALGGHELLRYIKRYRRLSPVVVLTQFNAFGRGKSYLTLAQLNEQLKSEYGSLYLGAVYYGTSSEGWRRQLTLLIKAVAEAR